MKGCLKLVGYGVLALVGLVFLGALFGGRAEQPVTVRSVPTFTPTPGVSVFIGAPTATPTHALRATITAAPLVGTPVAPTFTPVPPDTSVMAYVLDASGLMDNFVIASRNLAPLMQNPRIGQDDWTLQVAVNLARIRFVYEELESLDPPSVFRPAHTVLVEATALCNAATYNIAAGIDDLDVSKINLAAEQINDCIAGLYESSEMLQELAPNTKGFD